VYWAEASLHATFEQEMQRLAADGCRVFLTVDADAFTVADVPGVSAPNPAGYPGLTAASLARTRVGRGHCKFRTGGGKPGPGHRQPHGTLGRHDNLELLDGLGPPGKGGKWEKSVSTDSRLHPCLSVCKN